MSKLLSLALISSVLLFAGSAYAEESQPEIAVQINGKVFQFSQQQLDGLPIWQVKLKCFKGDKLVTETEVQVLDGHTGYANSTRTRGNQNPYTGKVTYKTRMPFFLHIDARHDGQAVTAEFDKAFAPLLPQTQSFALGNLKLHLSNEDADRFEAEIYMAVAPGYDLDYSKPGVPVASQRSDAIAAKLV